MSRVGPFAPIPAEVDAVARSVVDAIFEVRRELGAGLLESAYQQCLAHELRLRGHLVEEQVLVPLAYKGTLVGRGFRMDLVVDRCVVVELKATAALDQVHEAQLLTYLRLSGHRVGLLVNLNEGALRDGIRRLVV